MSAEESNRSFNVKSGWLPEMGSASMRKFHEMVMNAETTELAPCIKALNEFIEGNLVIKHLVDSACIENANLLASKLPDIKKDMVPEIKNKEDLLHKFNHLLTAVPQFIDYDLVGLPFSAYVVGIDPTLSGSTLFRLPMFNLHMKKILQVWNTFLATPASNIGFSIEGRQWLSDTAKRQYEFDLWKKDSEELPYWESWNSFFTRQFKDRELSRPISDPLSNRTAICPNDGSMYKWEANIAEKDVFWFKDMKYSLSDILSSPDAAQQKVITEHGLLDIFKGGYIFQTYLNPYNFHRWWCPVNAEILFEPLVVDGCFFNKLVIPDFGGATTESLPYLAEVNAKGIIVFKTEEYGHVCCIPLGMSEVSTIEFDSSMKAGAKVTKGQEMGKFNYGGSSFAVIYERLPGKKLVFENSDGVPYQENPVVASGSSGTGGEVTLIGSKIGVWQTVVDEQFIDLNVANPVSAKQLSMFANSGAQFNESYNTWSLISAQEGIDFQLSMNGLCDVNLSLDICSALVDGTANSPATVRVNGVELCVLDPQDGNFTTVKHLIPETSLNDGQNIISISLNDTANGQLWINKVAVG